MPDGIELTGWNEFEVLVKNLPQKVVRQVTSEINAAAKEWAFRAKQSASTFVDEGVLMGGITSKNIGHMEADVYSNAVYSPYVEWGTGHRANVPSEFSSYASTFQGPVAGASSGGFYDLILAWVKRKGITGTYSVKTHRRQGGKVDNQIETEQVAYAIYLSILRHGIKPHPFFFIHMQEIKTMLMNNIQMNVINKMNEVG